MKKLPDTSYRALAIMLVVIILFILVICYDLWTGTILARHWYGYTTTWAKDPIAFVISIGFLIAMVACALFGWYLLLLRAIRAHRTAPFNPKKPR